MCDAMRDQVYAWAENPAAKAILLKSSSERAFCSGGDVKALALALAEDPASQLPAQALAAEYSLLLALRSSPLPTIAVLDGVTMGFGLGLSGNARTRVVTERTLAAMPECAIGLFPDVGFARLYRARPAEALYLGLSGARLGAKSSPTQDLLDLGIGTSFVPSDKLPALLSALGEADLSGDAAAAVARAVGAFACGAPPPAEDAPPALAALAPAIERCFGAQRASVGDITAALGAETGTDGAWAKGALAGMAAGAPLSRAATLAHYRAVARGLNPLDTMEDVLAAELRLAGVLTRAADFREGVGARLIDKTKAPRWAPPADADVTADMVRKFFSAAGEGADDALETLRRKRPRRA